ncbi:MAG: leucyl/phenylalanyl-tRNA--protein transferase [Pseudomonadota bacterium]
MELIWIAPDEDFPPLESALAEPDGLLCAGGDLSTRRLLRSYQLGIFPWYSEGEPILWWSPAQRAIIPCKDIHISRSMRRCLNRGAFDFTQNRDFAAVIDACSEPRPGQFGTWITPEMREAYLQLHRIGHAHSFECWYRGELVGGVYGVGVGRVLSGESMFSRHTNASKASLIHIATSGLYDWIDCQVMNPHLASMGAIEIPRSTFCQRLAREQHCHE